MNKVPNNTPADTRVEIPTMFDESLWVKVTQEPDGPVVDLTAQAGEGVPQTVALSLEQAAQLATTLTLLCHTAKA